jgi:hypothetical protein
MNEEPTVQSREYGNIGPDRGALKIYAMLPRGARITPEFFTPGATKATVPRLSDQPHRLVRRPSAFYDHDVDALVLARQSAKFGADSGPL